MDSIIYKYSIGRKLPNEYGKYSTRVTAGAKIISVGIQRGDVVVWAIVERLRVDRETKHFHIVGTGIGFNTQNMRFLGTVMDGPFVWHVFEDRVRPLRQ
ncbi:MAG: hypothetical protein GY847_14340 [Proteobacteria bacterium]|nr:hypothetical protein [Pseudomonadota bacterium]